MPVLDKLNPGVLESIAKLLGDTNSGFTGSEIAKLLTECAIPDPQPASTKWKRLYEAFRLKQDADGCANNICAFIQESMNPARHYSNDVWFATTRHDLNKILSFAGLLLGANGKLTTSQIASTITQAAARASTLRENLVSRNVHPAVLKYCKEELLVDNYFHAVFEATKSVAEEIRAKSGLISDGVALVDEAFSFKSKVPYLALNRLQTESERSEQLGFMNLLRGLFGTFRNTTAHAPKITWPISEQDALDILSLVSLIHRRLETAIEANKICQDRIQFVN